MGRDGISPEKIREQEGTTVSFLKGQKPDKLTLNVALNGKGTLWIDGVVLAGEP